MVTKYKVVHWEFDNAGFARVVSAWVETVGWEPVAEVVGVSKSTVLRWARGGTGQEFDYPSMTNFIKVCDELSLYPADFFTTSEG